MNQDSDEKNNLKGDLADYRNALLQADEAAVREYDKTVIYLSGGAIGISFTFLKSVCESGVYYWWGLLLLAWFLWGLSVLVVLVSHYFSHRAMRCALKDLNDERLNYENPGRGWDTAINFLNPIGGFLFVLGLAVFLIFVGFNFYLHNAPKNQPVLARQVVTVTTTTITKEQTNNIQGHNDDEGEEDIMSDDSNEN